MKTNYLAAALAACTLAACGGGGGSTPSTAPGSAEALASLQGKWYSGCTSNGFGGSQIIRFEFAGNQQTNFIDTFSDQACSISSKATVQETAMISIGGSVTTPLGFLARKIDATFTDDNSVLKTIFSINDQQLLVGDQESAKDSEGRDTELNTNLPFSSGTPPTGGTDPTPTQSPDPVTNSPPTVSAGDDFSVTIGSMVTLSGTATDAEDAPNPPSVQWTQMDGPTVTLLDDMTLTPSFEAPQVNASTELLFQIVATDNQGLTAQDIVYVLVTIDPCTQGDGNSDPSCATDLGIIAEGTSASANQDIFDGGDVDYFQFSFNRPNANEQDVVLTVTSSGGSNLDPVCKLFKGSELIYENDDAGINNQNCQIPTAIESDPRTYLALENITQYTLEVAPFGETSAGTYELVVTALGPVVSNDCNQDADSDFACAISASQNDSSFQDSIDVSQGDTSDFYEFEVEDPLVASYSSVTVTVTATNASDDFQCRSFAQDTSARAFGCEQTFSSPAGRKTFYFEVYAPFRNSAADYQLQLTYNQ